MRYCMYRLPMLCYVVALLRFYCMAKRKKLLVCVCGNWFGTKNGAQTLVGGFLQEIRAESRLICYCTSWQRTPILVGAGWSSKQKPKMAEKFSPNYDLFTQKPFNCKVCVRDTDLNTILLCHSSEIRGWCLMKCSSKMLQNLPYFILYENPKFSFCATLFFSLMNTLIYVDIDQGIY